VSPHPQEPSKFLGDGDIDVAAQLIGCEPAAIRAVLDVESLGGGFLADGRPKILFERHWFYALTPKPVSKERSDLSWPNPGGYIGGAAEWDRLNDAIAYDRVPALMSAS
jgi:hypothetical protein